MQANWNRYCLHMTSLLSLRDDSQVGGVGGGREGHYISLLSVCCPSICMLKSSVPRSLHNKLFQFLKSS